MDYAGERRRLHTAPSTSSAQPSHLFDAGVELDQQFAYARRPMSGDASQSTYGTPWDLDWTQHSRSSAAEPPLPRHYEFVSLQHPSVHDQSSLGINSLREEPVSVVPRTAPRLVSAISALGLSMASPTVTSSTMWHYTCESQFSPPPPLDAYPLPSRSTSLSMAPLDPSIVPNYRSHSNPTTPSFNPTHTSSLFGYSSNSRVGERPHNYLSSHGSYDTAWSPPPFDPSRLKIRRRSPSKFYPGTDAYSTPGSSISVVSQANWTFPTYDKPYDAVYTDGSKRRKTSPIDVLPLPPQYPLAQGPFYSDHRWGHAPGIEVPDPDYMRYNARTGIPAFHSDSTPHNEPRPPLLPSPTGSQTSITYSVHSEHNQSSPPPTAPLPLSSTVPSPSQIECRPSAADFERTGDMIPQSQSVRFHDDKYRPIWVRGVGHSKEGWCKLCPDGGSWFQLRTSAYWYHLQFVHGVSATTGHYFPTPLETRSVEPGDRTEGLCHGCGKWTLYRNHRTASNVSKNPAAWFRHSYACLKKLHKSGAAAAPPRE